MVGEIEAYVALPDAERRARRLRKLSALENAANAWRRCADVFEVARPAEAGELRKVLGPDLGRYLSSAAYGAFLGLPVSPTLSPRDRESRAATSRAGPYPLLEEYARIQRQELASLYGHRLFAAFAKHHAERLEAELEKERLNTGGRPAARARRIALARLLDLHQRLSGRPLPSQPSEAFRDFAQSCFAAIGLPTEGLDPAVDRLFDRLRPSRKAST